MLPEFVVQLASNPAPFGLLCLDECDRSSPAGADRVAPPPPGVLRFDAATLALERAAHLERQYRAAAQPEGSGASCAPARVPHAIEVGHRYTLRTFSAPRGAPLDRSRAGVKALERASTPKKEDHSPPPRSAYSSQSSTRRGGDRGTPGRPDEQGQPGPAPLTQSSGWERAFGKGVPPNGVAYRASR